MRGGGRKLYMNDIKNIEILNNAFCPMKETSLDNHDGNLFYITESMINVINFDSVKDKYIEKLFVSETPKSNDALYIHNNGEMYFIEFKSGYMSSKKIYDVRLKIFDSLLIFTDIINKGISFTRKNLNYILVYNEIKNPLTEAEKNNQPQISQSRVNIGKYFTETKAKKKFIRFSLERFEKLYFKNVFTVTQNEFENYFIKNWSDL
jgi:hypothetical protein